MSTGLLTIDLDAIVSNWRALAAKTQAEAGAVVKADAYGLGAGRVAAALARAGARKFFVAAAEEGAAVRKAVGAEPEIFVFGGHDKGDAPLLSAANLIPMLNSPEQFHRHREVLPSHGFGIQLDTGMNRLGFEWDDWAVVAPAAIAGGAKLIMSHLACSDEPAHPMNAYQLDLFTQMTEGVPVARSLSATGGILLGAQYHFDVVRPGIGLYAAEPFTAGQNPLRLEFPVLQVRSLVEGEVVGYSNTWQAKRPSRIATIAGGYADGLHRALGAGSVLFAGSTPCPLVGRISMDLITVDVTDLPEDPQMLTLICDAQRVDALAATAKTIGYEIMTSFGARYTRRYIGG